MKKNNIPKGISQEILKKIFRNLLLAILAMGYFAILNLAYNNIKQERLVEDLKVFSGVFLIVGIIILEKAYKEDNGKKVIGAIEAFVMSIHTLTIMHVITMFNYDFRLYLLTSSYIIAAYFVLKSIILYTKSRKEYLDSFSDISEIIKKDEPVKKEATKQKKEKENRDIKESKTDKEVKENKNNIAKKVNTKAKKSNNRKHIEKENKPEIKEDIKKETKKKTTKKKPVKTENKQENVNVEEIKEEKQVKDIKKVKKTRTTTKKKVTETETKPKAKTTTRKKSENTKSKAEMPKKKTSSKKTNKDGALAQK